MSKEAGAESVLRRRGTVESHSEINASATSIEKDETKLHKTPKFTGIKRFLCRIEPVLAPIVITFLALWSRIHKIDISAKVIWDEAHFGKFGSQYIKGEYYHDVHPPLGKMLVGLSGYLSGYNGSFLFETGKPYPDWVDFRSMRCFQALFSAGCVPVAYFTAKALGLSYYSVIFVTLMVLCENSFVALGRFILLDSMLIYFTTTTFLCLAQVHRLRKSEFSMKWFLWMVLSGCSIGCVCSVKWVGLFVTSVTGIYTAIDLWLKTWDLVKSYGSNNKQKQFMKKLKIYILQWVVRIVTLIVIPTTIYMACFKIHFTLLKRPGTGSASMNTLFQANLLDPPVMASMPRDVIYGSRVTLRSHGLSPNLLHSHVSTYPDGSQQQQVTTYGFSDGNNNFIVHFPRGDPLKRDQQDFKTFNETEDMFLVKDTSVIRLQHEFTAANLHSHRVKGHVTKSHWEVSGYGNNEIGDEKDNWIVEIVKQVHSSDAEYARANETAADFLDKVHPISTVFRLKHQTLGCYLSTTGASYPAWGFKQGEVTCRKSNSKSDKSTWWNIEFHENDRLEFDTAYKVPKNNFLDDFVMAHYSMMSSNNALVPDPMKTDEIASEWWEWPILFRGLRMCGWGPASIRYYLLSNPFTTYASTISIFAVIGITIYLGLKWDRQLLVLNNADYNWYFIVGGLFPLLGWFLHYLPFVVMGRVTYFHHYMPALYFAMFTLAFVIEYFTVRANRIFKFILYFALYAGVIGVFYFFSPLCYGMSGPHSKHQYLNVISSWTIEA